MIGMEYLVLMKREIYSIEVEGNKLLHLCLSFVFKIIVCKDDVFLAFTTTNYENMAHMMCHDCLVGSQTFDSSHVHF